MLPPRCNYEPTSTCSRYLGETWLPWKPAKSYSHMLEYFEGYGQWLSTFTHLRVHWTSIQRRSLEWLLSIRIRSDLCKFDLIPHKALQRDHRLRGQVLANASIYLQPLDVYVHFSTTSDRFFWKFLGRLRHNSWAQKPRFRNQTILAANYHRWSYPKEVRKYESWAHHVPWGLH